MQTLLFCVLLFVIVTHAQTIGNVGFVAQVAIRETNMENAFQTGTLTYDFIGQRFRLDYTGVEFFELYTWRGATGQFVYKSGAACRSTCETAAITYSIPIFFVNSTYYNSAGNEIIQGTSYAKYTPRNATSPIRAIYTSGSRIHMVAMNTGRTFTFTSVTPTSTFADSLFVSPSGCSCGNRLDISVVVDRSGSIRRVGEWNFVVEFVRTTINRLTFGNTGVYLGISNFNHDTWVTLTMTEGASKSNAEASIPRLDYCKQQSRSFIPSIYQQCANTEGATEGDLACCNGWTCIECAVQVGLRQLRSSPRINEDIDRVLIVITDGSANRRPTSTFNTPGPSCSPPSGNGLNTNSNWSQVTQNAINSATGQCWNQIYRELQRAKQEIPRLSLFSVGIGTNEVSNLELEVLAGGDQTHKFSVANFADLGGILDRVIASICIPQAKPCGDCCGFCICGTCTKPTSCDPAGPCKLPVQHDTCCVANRVADSVICPPINCKNAICDPNVTTNNGCVYTNETRCSTFSNVCETYGCSATTGLCVKTWENPQCYNECVLPEDCRVDKCKTYACTNITLSDAATGTSRVVSRCSVTGDVDCSSPNKCTPRFCDSQTGQCQNAPEVTCSRNPPECWNSTCVPSTGLCNFAELTGPTCSSQCVVDANCTDTNQCTNEICVVNGTRSRCDATNVVCTDLDACHRRLCSPDAGCVWQNVTCPANTPCETFECDLTNGQCKKTVNISCVDKCVVDQDCFLDRCQTSLCVQGETAKVCNHSTLDCGNRTCASVSCNPATGCTYTAFADDYCNDFNPCTNETCVEGTGCVYTDFVCPTNNTDPCILVTCDRNFGCITSAKSCPRERVCEEELQFYKRHSVTWKSEKEKPEPERRFPPPACDVARRELGVCQCTLVDLNECSIAYCDSDTGRCVELPQPCGGAITTGQIVAATLGAGAIVGIIIAVIICAGVAGGSGYGLYTKMNDTDNAVIESNPLYMGASKGGDNPLHAAGN